MKTVLVGANWKMNKTMSEAVNYISKLNDFVNLHLGHLEVFVCIPFTLIHIVANMPNLNIKIGAQNVHWEKFGPFTGEISAPMLKDIGCTYVIVGHHERRSYFGESDIIINKKLLAALEKDMTVILCVGEQSFEHLSGRSVEVVKAQLDIALDGVPVNYLDRIIVAYEPTWAIGTCVTPQNREIETIVKVIRSNISARSIVNVTQTRILYGGSVNFLNAQSILANSGTDGLFLGRASFDLCSFINILNSIINWIENVELEENK